MTTPTTFRFLNVTRDLALPSAWNDPAIEKLWLYNLHYFEDLVAEGAGNRTGWHEALIDRWIDDNPPFGGNGWEPYPVSMRIGHWIKWALSGNTLDERWLDSLAQQAEYLYHRCEWHLLGNHLLENAKALVLAGTFFQGAVADKWRRRGLNILRRQFEEQVLADGGHFERSPMYHGLMLEAVLDLVGISEHFGMNTDWTPRWRHRAAGMAAWLQTMTHPDGEISFFNDAAVDIALPPGKLVDYAERLDVPVGKEHRRDGVTFLEQCGYLRVERGRWTGLLDVAPVGPDYQPGHAHADTLSFELSVDGQRILVNSGTGLYEAGAERRRQRGTAAHNTVVVDGLDSSEVWSSFRVARRARPFVISVRGTGTVWETSAVHDGYRRLPGQVTHHRRWSFTDTRLVVDDRLQGSFGHAVSFFHFHPDVSVELDGRHGVITTRSGVRIVVSIEEGSAKVSASSYHPEFGESHRNHCLEVTWTGSNGRVGFELEEFKE